MYTLGIDIGSTSTKAVILQDGDTIVASSLYAVVQVRVALRALFLIYSKKRSLAGMVLPARLPRDTVASVSNRRMPKSAN